MANPFCHVELNANDPAAALDFYSRLFDWKIDSVPISGVPGGVYHMIAVGDGTGGGIMKNPMESGPSWWLSYVLVDDLPSSTRKARELGAKIIVDNQAAGDYGWLSIIEDPQGAVLGLWKANG